jgi:hypothetical protein
MTPPGLLAAPHRSRLRGRARGGGDPAFARSRDRRAGDGHRLDWRAANGNFASIEDLMSVTGVGDKTFEQLKDLVTA